MEVNGRFLDPDQNTFVFSYYFPVYTKIDMTLTRYVGESDVDDNRNLQSMPGFSIKWSWNLDIKPDSMFIDTKKNFLFRR